MILTLILIAAASFILQIVLQWRTAISVRYFKVWKVVHVSYTGIVFYVVMYNFPGFDFMSIFYCVLAWGAITDIRFTVPCICGAVVAAIFQSFFGG